MDWSKMAKSEIIKLTDNKINKFVLFCFVLFFFFMITMS